MCVDTFIFKQGFMPTSLDVQIVHEAYDWLNRNKGICSYHVHVECTYMCLLANRHVVPFNAKVA